MKRPVLKIQYDSPVVLTFALLSLAALLLNSWTNGASNTEVFSVYRSSLTDPLTYVRMFCHVLGHADFSHFVSNICLILVLGPVVERYYGSVELLVSIVITALASGIIHFVFFPQAALLGASGIVFMMIFLASISGFSRGTVPISLILVAILYLGQEIYSMVHYTDNVSHITHVIGGVCGIICGACMGKKGRKRQ